MDIRGTLIPDRIRQRDGCFVTLCHALGVPAQQALPEILALGSRLDTGVSQLVAALLQGETALTGVGPKRLDQLAASLRLAEVMASESLRSGTLFEAPEVCARWLQLHMGLAGREQFCGLFLDAGHRLIAAEDLFHGTVDGASVYPRVVVERALRLGACAVIVAHNHPSGSLEPSQADIRITRRLREALGLVDIRLLDHFIVGGGDFCSLAQSGHC